MSFDAFRNNPADGWRQREAMLVAGLIVGRDVKAIAGPLRGEDR